MDPENVLWDSGKGKLDEKLWISPMNLIPFDEVIKQAVFKFDDVVDCDDRHDYRRAARVGGGRG